MPKANGFLNAVAAKWKTEKYSYDGNYQQFVKEQSKQRQVRNKRRTAKRSVGKRPTAKRSTAKQSTAKRITRAGTQASRPAYIDTYKQYDLGTGLEGAIWDIKRNLESYALGKKCNNLATWRIKKSWLPGESLESLEPADKMFICNACEKSLLIASPQRREALQCGPLKT